MHTDYQRKSTQVYPRPRTVTERASRMAYNSALVEDKLSSRRLEVTVSASIFFMGCVVMGVAATPRFAAVNRPVTIDMDTGRPQCENKWLIWT